MADREGTPEEFAAMAAGLRGGGGTAGVMRRITPNPSPLRVRPRITAASWRARIPSHEPEQAEEINVEALLTQRIKPGHAALIRALHPDELTEIGGAVS